MNKIGWKMIYMIGGGALLLAALFLAFCLGTAYGRKTAPASEAGDPGREAGAFAGQGAEDPVGTAHSEDPTDTVPEDPLGTTQAGDPGEKAPMFGAFSAQTLSGATVTDADFACGKIVVVNCFGTFCGPCIEEMPDLEKLSKELDDVSFFGVCTDLYGYDKEIDKAQVDLAESIVDTCGVTYPVIIPSRELQEDYFDGIVALPCTYILSGDGELLETVMGRQTYEAWKEILIHER